MANQEALGPIFHNQIIPQFVNARKAKNISQLEMDEVLGVAKGLVSKWECGIRKPSGWLLVYNLDNLCIFNDRSNQPLCNKAH